MPWNPAVLDQRIARVHRLGQKQKVQIFVLMAEDSYGQQVARLVKGKRDLFDNVIDPDAAEDVVGVSKKMLETLIDDLVVSQPATETAEDLAEPEPEAESPPVLAEAALNAGVKPTETWVDDGQPEALDRNLAGDFPDPHRTHFGA